MRYFALIALALSAGCAKDDAPASKAESSEHRHRTAKPSTDAPEAGYDLDVELPPQAKAGQEALAKVRVFPRAPWHMNTAFQARLRLDTPDGVELAAPEQGNADAERLDEEGLVFAVPFTPRSHGAKTFRGELDFAVCGDSACAPTSVPVTFAVDVCDPGRTAPQSYAC